MDNADRAGVRMEFEAQIAEKNRLANMSTATSECCIECGIKISAARREAALEKEYCVACLELIE